MYYVLEIVWTYRDLQILHIKYIIKVYNQRKMVTVFWWGEGKSVLFSCLLKK